MHHLTCSQHPQRVLGVDNLIDEETDSEFDLLKTTKEVESSGFTPRWISLQDPQ